MPTAAAAAVSPVVPTAATAAAPPDPYGRCWQSQVDPGACFPYFGTLYGSSLPPPSYRMQPGCMSNLGQFWPPTPPPEGCVRYDGANNLHYCSPLTPVFRHGESLPQNMLGVHQRLSHYSHLIDVNKDSGLKRLDSCSESRHRQKASLLSSKHGKESQQIQHHHHQQQQQQQQQQRLCHCYECNEKCASRSTTQSVNKENISSPSKLLEQQKYSEDRAKTARNCRKIKSDCYNGISSHGRSSAHSNGSAINSYNCSVDQNVAKGGGASMQMSALPDPIGAMGSQKLDSGGGGGAVVSNAGYPQYDFLRPDSRPVHSSSRCSSNSLLTVASPNNVHSEMKASEQARYENSSDKSQQKMHVSTSCYAPCVCSSVQTSSSSSKSQNSENSCCFSPPCLSSRTLYHNYPESSVQSSKTPSTFVVYGNGYNASPLKNVYFSYYESENFDQASGTERKHGRDSLAKQEKSHQNHSYSDNRLTSSVDDMRGFVMSNSGPSRSSCSFGAVSTPSRSQYGNSPALSNSHGYQYQPVSTAEQQQHQKAAANVSSRYSSLPCPKRNETPSYCERVSKVGPAHIKQEKVDSPDCKFQRSHGSGSSRYQSSPVTVATSGVLNLSTSMRCPKIEPQDGIATSSSEQCISAASPLNSPSSYSYSNASMKNVASKSAQAAYPEELKFSETEHRYVLSAPAANNPVKCQAPVASSSLQMQAMENDCAPVVPEDLVSVMQPEPLSGAESAVSNDMPAAGSEAPIEARHEMDCQEPAESKVNVGSAVDPLNCEPPDLSESILCDGDNCGPPPLCEPMCSSHDDVSRDSELQNEYADDLPPKLEQHCDPPPPVGSAHSVDHTFPSRIEIGEKSREDSTKPCGGGSDDGDAGAKCCEGVPSLKQEIPSESPESVPEEIGETAVELKPDISMETSLDDHQESRDESGSCEKDAEVSAVEDCHGLYLLLEGIEHRNSVDDKSLVLPIENDAPRSNSPERISTRCVDTVPDGHSGKKLNALCAFVEQQFAAEFGDHLRISSPAALDQQDSQTSLISNYPTVKSEDTVVESPHCAPSLPCEASSQVAPVPECSKEATPEQEMRKKLAELQQKYKEKQKELARLRPKKMKASSLDSSRLSDTSSTSNNSLCHSSYCSKDETMSSVEQSPEKPPQLDFVSHGFRNLSGAAGASSSSARFLSNKEAVKVSSSRFSVLQSPREKHTRSLSRKSSSSSKASRSRSIVKRKFKLRSDKRSGKVSCCRTSRRSVSSRSKTGQGVNSSSQSSLLEDTKSRLSTESEQTGDESRVLNGAKHSRSGKRKLSKSKESKRNQERTTELNGFGSKQKSLSDGLVIGNCTVSPAAGKSPKKRKSENPQRYMPSKQVRLTETIIAKQLRNRILFEAPSFGGSKNIEKYDFPEELSDALRKCHLGEGSEAYSRKSSETHQSSSTVDSSPKKNLGAGASNGIVLKMSHEHLVENKRILAMEDGLFYAGCIREIQSPDVYAISLDGQRGNKKHIFSQEEMLSQTILELKPASLDELPEGTRVCAYWSHQYRCLYPGTVMKAPTPSADWSEPRVFVEFDDGDSAQIAMKNIRFLPADILLSADEEKCQSETASYGAKDGSAETKKNSDRKKRKAGSKNLRKHSRTGKNDEMSGMEENAENSAMIQVDHPQSLDEGDDGDMDEEPSHNCEDEEEDDDDDCPAISKKALKRTLRQQSKRKLDSGGSGGGSGGNSSKSKSKENNSSPEKKKHKKYKDRHKHHHHHRHHRHHHKHCHRHRHCKKHKHHKRASNIDNIINVVIPSTSIPLGNLITKSTRSSVKEAETQCVGHSRNDKLPQIMAQSADLNGTSDKISNKKDISYNR